MQKVTVKKTTIGEGIPKICIPLTGEREEEILRELEEAKRQRADLIEWRADCCLGKAGEEKIWELLKTISDRIGNIPLLFTYRSKKEGGNGELCGEDYVKLLKKAAETGLADLIDVEVFSCKEAAGKLIACLHGAGAKVIGSNHHFERTPEKKEMIERLKAMEEAGADILKIAVMPKETGDLYTLLEATAVYSERSQRPLITMSMARAGVLSRLCGEISGSAVTFGAGLHASAPGQVPAGKLRQVLELIHEIQKPD